MVGPDPTQQRDSSSYRTQPYPAGERHEPWNPQALILSICRLTPALEQQGPEGRDFRIMVAEYFILGKGLMSIGVSPSVLVFCCMTNNHNFISLKTVHRHYLTVLLDQQSRYDLAGS